MARRTIAVVVAVILALAAAILVWWYATSVREEAEKAERAVTVLVAAEGIPARTTGEAAVEGSLTTTAEVPERLVAPGALTSASELQGRVFLAPVAKGQQIVSSQLGTPEAAGAAFKVKPGMRAVAVSMDRVRGVGGVPAAGDRVDVVVTFDFDDLNQALATLAQVLSEEELAAIAERGYDAAKARAAFTRTILQQIEVLAIDNIGPAPGESTATVDADAADLLPNPVMLLMMAPADVERLVFAEEQGSVWFTLVPTEDTEPVPTPGRVIMNVFDR